MKVIYFNIVIRIFSTVAIFYFFNQADTNDILTIIKYIFIVLLVVYFILLTLYDINIINYNNKLESEMLTYISTLKVVKYVLSTNADTVYVSPKIYDSIDISEAEYLVGRQFDMLLDPYRNDYSIGQVRYDEIIDNVRSLYEQ